jgi:phenylacetic acid degradation operon negative regulatory protein
VRPRSIVLDLCGDYVRYHGGAIGLGAMTELLRAFDVADDNVRVLMSRLRREGFFDTQKDGRTTSYVITDGTLRTLDEGRARIFARGQQPWSGDWHMVIYQVPETARASRERLRTGLAWLGFGPLAPSTWMSVHDRHDGVAALFAEAPDARVDQVTARTSGLTEDRSMAARCWDLERLAEDSRRWLKGFENTDTPTTDAEALVARVELVHEYRKFPFSDPDLPADLLPEGWPGADAHALFLRRYEQLRHPAERFYRRVTGDGGGTTSSQ